VPLPGGYSITATSSKERAAKIIIYERGFGQERGAGFPNLDDGVYVMLRSNDASAAGIWTKVMQGLFPVYFALMSPSRTLGVAPPCQERFMYFRVDVNETLDRLAEIAAADQATWDAVLSQGAPNGAARFIEIAGLLEGCSRV
jgi:hypothetical protein